MLAGILHQYLEFSRLRVLDSIPIPILPYHAHTCAHRDYPVYVHFQFPSLLLLCAHHEHHDELSRNSKLI
jgi:hypothetical protein